MSRCAFTERSDKWLMVKLSEIPWVGLHQSYSCLAFQLNFNLNVHLRGCSPSQQTWKKNYRSALLGAKCLCTRKTPSVVHKRLQIVFVFASCCVRSLVLCLFVTLEEQKSLIHQRMLVYVLFRSTWVDIIDPKPRNKNQYSWLMSTACDVPHIVLSMIFSDRDFSL